MSGSSAPPKRTRVILVILVSILLISGSWFLTHQKESDTIIVTFPSGKKMETEVADTPEKLLFGLAFREALLPGSGMLYIFEASGRHRVMTKGFLFPVDIIWANESRHVVHVVADAQPCQHDPCAFYGPPPENARYVIETAAGFLQHEPVAPGMELKFTLRL